MIDLKKLKEAITFVDGAVEEKQASAEDHMTKLEEIDITTCTEEEFVEKAVAAIGDVNGTTGNGFLFLRMYSKNCS